MLFSPVFCQLFTSVYNASTSTTYFHDDTRVFMDTGPTELCAQSNNLLLEDEKYSANHDRHSSKYNSKDQVGITILKATKK